jgi:hypothetical protein
LLIFYLFSKIKTSQQIVQFRKYLLAGLITCNHFEGSGLWWQKKTDKGQLQCSFSPDNIIRQQWRKWGKATHPPQMKVCVVESFSVLNRIPQRWINTRS